MWGPPPNERYCKVCNLNKVEDEYHFLFSCPLYQTERSNFYVDYVTDVGQFMILQDEEKVTWLLSEDKIKHTSCFLQTLYDKRRCILYKPN